MAGLSSRPTMGRTGGKPAVRRVLMALVPPVDALDLVGPTQVFAAANRLSGQEIYRVEMATTGKELTVEAEGGLISFVGGLHLDVARGPYDSVLVVCGPESRTRRDSALTGWLRAAAPRAQRLGAVGDGSFLLAEAGLLDGRKTAAQWKSGEELVKLHPKVKLLIDKVWAQDGAIFTSSGASAGIDLALAWVEHDLGQALAAEVAREFVLFLRRPAGKGPGSAALASEAQAMRSARELAAWIGANLGRKLTAAVLAAQAGLTVGALERAFRRETGTTLGQYVLHARVEAARRRIQNTPQSLPQIAKACGFAGADAMDRAFKRVGAAAPAGLRKKGRSAA
jgi:transcriptional regulator GlxA family with amidase domain